MSRSPADRFGSAGGSAGRTRGDAPARASSPPPQRSSHRGAPVASSSRTLPGAARASSSHPESPPAPGAHPFASALPLSAWGAAAAAADTAHRMSSSPAVSAPGLSAPVDLLGAGLSPPARGSSSIRSSSPDDILGPAEVDAINALFSSAVPSVAGAPPPQPSVAPAGTPTTSPSSPPVATAFAQPYPPFSSPFSSRAPFAEVPALKGQGRIRTLRHVVLPQGGQTHRVMASVIGLVPPPRTHRRGAGDRH